MQESFAGPFKAQSSPTSSWESVHSSHSHSHCSSHHHTSGNPSSSSGTTNHPGSLLEAEKYQLMERAVQPVSHGKNGGPLIRLDLERLSHIAVDVVATKIHTSVHVLYVASSKDGLIRKYSVLPRTQEACLVEIIDPFSHLSQLADRQIKTMQFLKQQVCLCQRSCLSDECVNMYANNSKTLLYPSIRTPFTSERRTKWSGWALANAADASLPRRNASIPWILIAAGSLFSRSVRLRPTRIHSSLIGNRALLVAPYSTLQVNIYSNLDGRFSFYLPTRLQL